MNNRVFPVLIGGILTGVLSIIPIIGMCCFFWALGGGLLAVFLYKQKTHTPITLGEGTLTGALAGAVGGLICFIVAVVMMGFLGGLSLMGQSRIGGEELLASFGPIVIGIVYGLFYLVFLTVCASLGGLIAAAIFQRSNNNQAPPPPPHFHGPSASGNYNV
jgi:hypothetical protein